MNNSLKELYNKEIKDNIADISIIYWDWEVKSFSIIWENNKPKTFIKNNGTGLLFIIKVVNLVNGCLPLIN